LTSSPTRPPPAFASPGCLAYAKTLAPLIGILFLNISPEMCGLDVDFANFGAQHHEVIRCPETPMFEQIAGTLSILYVESWLHCQHFTHWRGKSAR
jgi:hypothetical protein